MIFISFNYLGNYNFYITQHIILHYPVNYNAVNCVQLDFSMHTNKKVNEKMMFKSSICYILFFHNKIRRV